MPFARRAAPASEVREIHALRLGAATTVVATGDTSSAPATAGHLTEIACPDGKSRIFRAIVPGGVELGVVPPRRHALPLQTQKAFTVKESLSKGIGLLVALGVTSWVMLNCPVARAAPGGNVPGPGVCDYPGVGGSTFEAGAATYYCDFPIEENSTHWHCEYGGWNLAGPSGSGSVGGAFLGFGLTIPVGDVGGASGSCSWRWPDNTIGPAPNPPGAWKNYLVPTPPPPEHRAPPAPQAEPESGPPPVASLNPDAEPETPAYTNPAIPNPGSTQNPQR